MENNNSPKRERYEQAILTALGCTAVEGRAHAIVYRLLVSPTFQPVCAFEFSWSAEAGSFRHAALPTMTDPVSDYIWERSRATEVSAIEEAMFASVESVTAIDGAKGHELLQRFAILQRPSVSPEDIAAKDGATIRLDLRDEHGSFTLRAQLASTESSPELAAWLLAFLSTAREHVHDRRLVDQLKRLPSYFGLGQ